MNYIRWFKIIVFNFLIVFTVSCMGLAGSDSAQTRAVSGQLNSASGNTSLSLMSPDPGSTSDPLPDGQVSESVCQLDGDFTVRAVPAEGEVIDAELDSNLAFRLLLLTDRGYSLLFYQDGTLCGYLLNSVSGDQTLIGTGEQDFDFGFIELTEDGEFVPEHDCEDFYDTDLDGLVDADDVDFDGNGIEDLFEPDFDQDGIMDHWDCDDDNDGIFDESVSESTDGSLDEGYEDYDDEEEEDDDYEDGDEDEDEDEDDYEDDELEEDD